MQIIAHAALDQIQIAQIDYLFADAVFGTDASAYLYEIDKRGCVTGRVRVNAKPVTRAAQNAEVLITAREVHVNDKDLQTANMHMDALAASIANKLYQRQQLLAEVHHE